MDDLMAMAVVQNSLQTDAGTFQFSKASGHDDVPSSRRQMGGRARCFRRILALTLAFHPYVMAMVPPDPAVRGQKSFWSGRSIDNTKASERSFGFWEMQVHGGFTRDGTWFTGLWEQVVLYRPDYVAKKWLRAFRMNKETFLWMVDNYASGGPFEVVDTNLRFAIPKAKRVAIVIHFLAHGGSYESIGNKFDVSTSFVCQLCKEAMEYWGQEFVDEWISEPLPHDARHVMLGFEALMRLPQCIGAMDGTFVPLGSAPRVPYPEAYVGYKGYSCIILLAIVDANGKFLYTNSGRPGSYGDARTWTNSLLHKDVHQNTAFNGPSMLVEGEEILPFLVADAAFKLSPRVMKCYDNPSTMEEMALNYAVVRTRRVVETSFGRLKGRWRVLKANNLSDPVYLACISEVCCALHNVLEYRDVEFSDEWMQEDENPPLPGEERSGRNPYSTAMTVSAHKKRDALSKLALQRLDAFIR